jgi:hypothetical protein
MRVRSVAAIGLSVIALVVGASTGAAGGAAAQDRNVRIDQIQVLGTHNSYHLRPDRAMAATDASNYAHPPLDQQLDRGIRGLEVDIQNAPDFPVYHSIIVDQSSNCPTLAACLETVATWSSAHRDHLPLTIFLELKEIPTNTNPVLQQAIDSFVAANGLKMWDASSIDAVDSAVRRAFGKRLLTPDQVRGSAKTLRGALATKGWPTLTRARGRVMVILNSDRHHDLYVQATPTLQGRSMFVLTTTPTAPWASFVAVDQPDASAIGKFLRQGLMVRTQADADGVEARANDRTRATQALASGAQVVATDYDVADPTVGPYVVTLPGNAVARCNPVTAPESCRAAGLE